MGIVYVFLSYTSFGNEIASKYPRTCILIEVVLVYNTSNDIMKTAPLIFFALVSAIITTALAIPTMLGMLSPPSPWYENYKIFDGEDPLQDNWNRFRHFPHFNKYKICERCIEDCNKNHSDTICADKCTFC